MPARLKTQYKRLLSLLHKQTPHLRPNAEQCRQVSLVAIQYKGTSRSSQNPVHAPCKEENSASHKKFVQEVPKLG